MTKLTKKQIEEIRKLHKEGMKVKELAIKFKVQLRTIRYWLWYREKSLEIQKNYDKNMNPEKKKERYNKYKEYRNNYFKNKYTNDEEFRNKHIERVKRNRKC